MMEWRRPDALPDLRNADLVALDSETKDERLQAEKGPGWPIGAGYICGLSAAWREGGELQSIYVPLRHPDSDNFDRAQGFAWVRNLLAPGGPRIVTQNGLYDFGWLRTEAGIVAPADGRWEEIGAAATLIDENRFSYRLDDLCKWRGLPGKDDTLLRSTVERTFNVRCTTRGKNAPQAFIWRLPATIAGPYAEQDAVSTLLLHENLAPELNCQGLRDAYDLDRVLLPLVLEMSARGIRVDTETAARNSALFKQKRDAVLTEIASKLEISAVDMEDLNNTKWLAATCDRLGITYPRTPKGNPSFTSSAQSFGWMRQHPHWFPPLVVRAKEFHTAASKFLDLYVLDFAVNGRIYPSIHPFRSDDGGARSSRFSYSDPPLQQMASHDSEIAGPVRRCFLPEPGEAWATIDYKQQEFRLLVQEAATRGLRGAHDALARYCTDPDTDFHVLVAEIANIERETAKRANFANAYRAGLKKFAFTIVKPEAEAKAIRKQLADKVPFVAELAADCEKQANRDSYLTLFDGTRRHYDLWNVRFSDDDGPDNKACDYATAQRRQRDPNHPWFAGKLQRAGAYFAMNALIQGNGARQTKRWMLDCWREGIVPLLQMHDGLELSIGDPAQAERVAALARETVSFDVPMPADIKYGRTWADVAKHSWAELPAPQPPDTSTVDYQPPPKILATQRVSLIPPPAEDFPNLDAFVAFVIERLAMYQRRQAGEPWPWTQDPILGAWSFCNMYRALDRTTQWIWQHWCEPHVDDSDLWFAMLIARLVNRIETLEALGWPVPWDPAHFVDVMAKRPKGKLYGAAYVSPAFAGDHRPKYVTQADRIFTPMWENRETLRPRPGMLVAEFAEGLRSYAGLGDGFLAAQVVADTKPFGVLREAADYQSFALSGNGSRAGLNNVMGRPTDASWRKNDRDWYQRLTELDALTAPRFATAGLPPADFQDLQNRLCEFSKWWAIHSGEKQRLKRQYRPAAAPKPRTKKKAKPETVTVEPTPSIAPEIPDYILNDVTADAPRPETAYASGETSTASASGNGPGAADTEDRGDESFDQRDDSGYPHGERDTGKQEAFYIYCHADGSFYLGVKRTSTKQFPQYHWTGKQWEKGLPKDYAKIPYRLPELIKAPLDAWVVIAAGEKDAETAARLGFTATTNSGGEGKGQWTPELNSWFAGRQRVAIMEDNDKTGHAHAVEVANALGDTVADIRIVGFRELPAHGDLTDWIEADRSRGYTALLARIEAAQPATGYELIRASTITMRAVQWWWPGHLARGELEILTGQPDIGKSQVHCSYVAHMTTGKDWPDKAKGPPACDVIMLTAEDNMAHTLCPRLVAAGANLERVHILNKIRKDNRDRMFLLQEDLDVLARILTNNPAIGLVTLDPITAYLGGKLDSHRATDVRNQLGPLKELAERCDVAFSAITHPAKKPGLKALDHYIGSQAFIAAPRLGHICIPEFEDGEDGKPKATGRYLFATPKHNIYFAMPTLAYRLVSASGGTDALGDTISISRVQWEEEIGITADQALAAAALAANVRTAAGAVTFLLDILANGPVAKTVIQERAAQRGFTDDQLRHARKKAGIGTFKETGKKDGKWFWATPRHMPRGAPQGDEEP
jgi:DNA polymerase I-like protein with 3'-5' exonuclease and polymerase domains